MPRGFVWADYVSDTGVTFALRVDADYAEDSSRGWVHPSSPGTPVYPRGWTARRVTGLDESGHPQQAIVGTTSCDLWTGAIGTFLINASDETVHLVLVTGRLAERFTPRPP